MLTQDKKKLLIFENGIVIDQSLPKWVNAGKKLLTEEKKIGTKIVQRETYRDADGTLSNTMDEPFRIYSTADPYELKTDVNFDKIASATLRELTSMIKDKELNNILCGYGGMHGYSDNVLYSYSLSQNSNKSGKKGKLFKKIKSFFTRKPKPEFDVIDFFTHIKNASKESATEYRDRVSKYLTAIHNAKASGQVSLLETLLGQMIANKYESQLNAEGFYYAVDEKLVVDFAKKTEKGISLTYLKNFNRPLPQDVVDLLEKVNGFEVFDNYVVLHYDPNGEVYKETKKEEAKRKDPILFGVIAGSTKLYYITDWVDEYCDLTLEKFVDTLGIDKEDLNMNGKAEAKKAEVETKEKVKKPRKKRTTKKDKEEN